MAVNSINSYSNALDIIKSHSNEILEVNKDGTLRTQNGLDKLRTFGSRLVGKYDQVKQEKDAAVGNAITQLWANAVAARSSGVKGDIVPLLKANGKAASPYLERFLQARNAVLGSDKGKISNRAKDARVITSGANKPAKAVRSENAAALGRTQSAAQNYHHAQLKAIRSLSTALTEFATSDQATTDQGIAALSASQKLDRVATSLGKLADTKYADWGKHVLAPLQQAGFTLGKGPLADFAALSGADNNAKKLLDWAAHA